MNRCQLVVTNNPKMNFLKIYAFGGLGADRRVFQYLTLKNQLVVLDWIKPKKDEQLENYAKRMAIEYGIDKEAEFIILGVSFGGLVAIEISKLYEAQQTILISSVENRRELSRLIRFIGQIGILKCLPKEIFNPPRKIAHFLFGAEKKELLNAILDETDPEFVKWAVNELANWKNETKLENVLKLGGEKDKLLPPKGENTVIIKGGGHFMIVDKADRISEIIVTTYECLFLDRK